MDTIVMKFGGSSVADNEKLKIVAQKIIDMYNKENNIVVILSAQGKTTDKLINEASQIIEENTEYDKIIISGIINNRNAHQILKKIHQQILNIFEKWICYLVQENKYQFQN